MRWITFDRPEKLNMLVPDDLDEIVRLVRDDTDIDAIVFTGAGDRAFSGGMNIECFRGLNPDSARALIIGAREFLASVRHVRCPTICAVNGYCLGLAFELALVCDLRICSERASFGLPEIKVGMPSVLDSALLQQYVGLSKAKEMMLTGEIYPVADLEPLGLVNAVVAPSELEAETRRMLARLAGNTRTAVKAQKHLLEVWQNTSLEEGIDASVAAFAEVFGASETGEQVEAHYARIVSRRNAGTRGG